MRFEVKNARVANGMFVAEISDSTQEFFIQEKCKPVNVVELKAYRRGKTNGRNSQNNRAWGFARQIAKFMGESEEYVMQIAMHRAMTYGYTVKLDESGEPLKNPLNGRDIPVNWSDATTKDANLVIVQLEALAGFLEIELEGI